MYRLLYHASLGASIPLCWAALPTDAAIMATVITNASSIMFRRSPEKGTEVEKNAANTLSYATPSQNIISMIKDAINMLPTAKRAEAMFKIVFALVDG